MRRRGAVASAVATVFAADLLLDRVDLPWLLGGLLDEPAHLATAALVLANLPPAGEAWTSGYAVGSVAVDVDHLPLVPRHRAMRKRMPRPPAHTLLVPAVVAAAALFTRGRARDTAFGVATGTCVHFLRDAATGSGMAPLQPLSKRRGKAPYALYAVAVGLLAARAWKSR